MSDNSELVTKVATLENTVKQLQDHIHQMNEFLHKQEEKTNGNKMETKDEVKMPIPNEPVEVTAPEATETSKAEEAPKSDTTGMSKPPIAMPEAPSVNTNPAM